MLEEQDRWVGLTKHQDRWEKGGAEHGQVCSRAGGSCIQGEVA